MRALAILALVLTACTPYPQRVANTCQRLGYQPGTPLFLSCLQLQMDTDTYFRAQWLGVAQAGLVVASTPAPRPYHNQCSRIGARTYCNGVPQ